MNKTTALWLAMFTVACGSGAPSGGGGGGGSASGGGSSATGGGSGATGGGSSTNGGGTSASGGGTSATGGGTSASGGGTSANGGGTSATGGGTSATGGGSSGPITVSGYVYNANGSPTSGATVIVIGGGSAVSDSVGAFSIPSVTTPYTAAAVGSGGMYISVYYGLTRADPTLYVAGAAGMVAKNAQIGGSLNGTLTLPTPGTKSTVVLFESPETSSQAPLTDNPYSLFPSWRGPAATTGKLHAIQWTADAGLPPVSYDGYGELANITVADTNVANGKNITLAAVSSAQLSGTATAPSGFSFSYQSLELYLGTGGINLFNGTLSSGGFSYVTPMIPNATLSVSLGAIGPGSNAPSSGFTRNGLAPATTGTAFTLPTPPSLGLPIDNATGIALATQTFSWSAMNPSGLYVVSFVMTGRTIRCITAATSVTIPSTTELGIGTIPTSTAVAWAVSGYGGTATTTDAFTGTPGRYSQLLNPATGDTWSAGSAARNFTTQ